MCVVLVCGFLINLSLADEDPPPSSDAARDLVVQMGSEEFQQRQAAERELAQMGMSARDALLDGLQNDDPEIRRACQRVLTGVLELDFQKRVAAYVADKAGKQEHNLPGWERYREIAGGDKDARELFVQMLKAEAGLLESVEAGSVDAVRLRLKEVAGVAFNRNSRERKQPPRGTMAALLFACADPKLNVPEDAMTRANIHSLIGQGEFGVSLQKGPLQRPARAVLSQWIRMPATQALAPNKLRFAVIYDLKEPGIDLALHALSEKKNASATAVASAAEALGRLGGKPYAALLTDLIDDERMCSQRVTIKDGKREMIQIQVRDVALAWLVFTTGQDANAYGLGKAARYKDMLKKYPTQAFNFANFVYDQPDSRDKALAKWKAWLNDHPLPEPPRTKPAQMEQRPDDPPRVVAAKPVLDSPVPDDGELQPLRLDMADRLQVRDLIRARKLIEQGTFVEATTILGEVLAADGDYFYRAAPDMTLYKQLKAEAERLLGELPAAGRDAYELQFGPQARRALDLAVEAGNLRDVAKVDRSFFYTPAGAEATFLLGSYHRIGGRFTQAAMYFERLKNRSPWAARFEPSLSLQQAQCWYQSGFAERARDQLTQVLADEPEVGTLLAGRANATRQEIEQTLFGADDTPGQAAPAAPNLEWNLYRGNLAGNGITLPGSPYLKTLHAAALTQERYLDDTLQQIKKAWTEDRRTALPNVHPLIVDGAIVFRTPLSIRAVELETNELRWETTALNSLWHLVRFGSNADREGQQTHVADGLRQRLSEDPSFGTLSSNGRLLFAVVDAGFSLGPEYRPAIVRGDGRRQVDAGALRGFNRLAAYDVRTGKLVWELGGPAETKGESLTGGRFTGPPLPLGDQLYAVVDFDEQTQLVAIDADTGTLQQAWLLDTRIEETTSTVLNLVGFPMALTSHREGGVSPVFGEGLLVCCTPDHHYVAVDLASRSVRWSFEPPAREGPRPANIFLLQQQRLLNQQTANRNDRWVDGGALLVDGRALLTPIASDEIFCLDLTDGTLLWSAPREDGLYLAGAAANLAVVVGRQAVWARRLTDGKPAWSGGPVALPQGSAPSGRGYLTQDRLFVPLTSAEVVAIDLAAGRIVSTSQSPGQIVPENLVRSGDYVVSVGLAGVRKFETLDARAERLAAAGPSAAPTSLSAVDQAELLLYQGQLVEALELLRGIEGPQASPRTVALLGEATVQALRAGVAGADEIAADVEQSIDDPLLKGRLLERLATAYDHAGMPAAAFDSCLKLIDSVADGEQLVDVTAAHAVRRNRRIQGLVARLVGAADAELRSEFDREILERLHGDNPSRALEYFDFHPASNGARLATARELIRQKRGLQAELLLRRAAGAGSSEERATAAALLGSLLRNSGRSYEAARWYRELADSWKDTVCLDGKTGGELVQGLPSNDPVRQALDPANIWPVGNVTKKVTKREANQAKSVTYQLPLFLTGDAAPRTPRMCVDVDVQSRKFIGRDAGGAQLWQTDFNSVSKSVNAFALHNYSLVEGRHHGHLLVAWAGQKLAAIDALGSGKVLWQRDTTRVPVNNPWVIPLMGLRMQLGAQGWAARNQLPQPLIVTSSYIAFQQDRILTALDPVTGDTLWIRDDFDAGCDLFGDEGRLLVTPTTGNQATVLSAIDGSTLGRRTVPDRDKRLGTWGSSVVIWESGSERSELKLADPWGETTVWQREFPGGAKSWLVDGRQVGVLDSQGRFVVLNVATGAVILETSVDAVPDLENIVVLSGDRRYILIANRPPPKQEGPTSFNRVPHGFVEVEGQVYGLDAKTGQRLWKTDVTNQWFRVNHPAELPMLTFFKRHQKAVKTGNNSWRSDKPTVLIDCIDSRTGERIHSSKNANSYDQNYNLSVDPKKRQITLDTRLETVSLTFSKGKKGAG